MLNTPDLALLPAYPAASGSAADVQPEAAAVGHAARAAAALPCSASGLEGHVAGSRQGSEAAGTAAGGDAGGGGRPAWWSRLLTDINPPPLPPLPPPPQTLSSLGIQFVPVDSPTVGQMAAGGTARAAAESGGRGGRPPPVPVVGAAPALTASCDRGAYRVLPTQSLLAAEVRLPSRGAWMEGVGSASEPGEAVNRVT